MYIYIYKHFVGARASGSGQPLQAKTPNFTEHTPAPLLDVNLAVLTL